MQMVLTCVTDHITKTTHQQQCNDTLDQRKFNYNCYGNDTVYRGIFNNFQNEVNFTRKEIASNNQIIKMLLQNNNYLEKQFS